MHDGTCNNCNGGLSAQVSTLLMAGIAAGTAVAIIAIRPHEDNTALITLVLGLLTPTLAQLVGINKTQEVHKALCESAKISSEKKEEIKQLVVKDLSTTIEVKQQLVDAKAALEKTKL